MDFHRVLSNPSNNACLGTSKHMIQEEAFAFDFHSNDNWSVAASISDPGFSHSHILPSV